MNHKLTPLIMLVFFATSLVGHGQTSKLADAKKVLTNSIGMKLVLIPAGEFMMGSPKGEARFNDDEQQHRVRITNPFYMQTTEVTQGQWESVMRTKPWSGKRRVTEGSDRPATYVSWKDAQEFCRRLSAKDDARYRLPTEVEWERACRAGTSTAYHFGDDKSELGDYVWFFEYRGGFLNEDSFKPPQQVGRKKPNAFGLYDIHGNVWEWCMDWYDKDYYVNSPLSDPSGPSSGALHVARGGCCYNDPESCRSANRLGDSPDRRYWDSTDGGDGSVGFRVLCEVNKNQDAATEEASGLDPGKPTQDKAIDKKTPSNSVEEVTKPEQRATADELLSRRDSRHHFALLRMDEIVSTVRLQSLSCSKDTMMRHLNSNHGEEALQLIQEMHSFTKGLPPGVEKACGEAWLHWQAAHTLVMKGNEPQTLEEALKEMQEALNAFKRVSKTYRNVNTDVPRAHCYTNIGICLLLLKKHEDAIGDYRVALAIHRTTEQSLEGELPERVPGNDHEDARKLIKELIANRLTENRAAQAKCYLMIGVALRELAKAKEAIDNYEKAMQLFKRLPNAEAEQADCNFEIGNALHFLDRHEQAISHYQEALQAYRKFSASEREQADCYRSMGLALRAMGKGKEAEAMIREAESVLKRCTVHRTE